MFFVEQTAALAFDVLGPSVLQWLGLSRVSLVTTRKMGRPGQMHTRSRGRHAPSTGLTAHWEVMSLITRPAAKKVHWPFRGER